MSYSEREMHADLMCALTNLTNEVAALRKTIESSPILFPPIVKTEAELEPEEIPEAVTARWRVWDDPLVCRRVGYCTECNNREEVNTHNDHLPSICPQCKAVMIGVE